MEWSRKVNIEKVNEYKRIWIIGAVASGKTTLARSLAVQNECFQYELDNLVHIRRSSGNIRRSVEDINEILERIYRQDTWIVEGVYRKEYHDLLENVDCILLLNTPAVIRNERIFTRWLKQRYKFESCHYEPTIDMLKYMFAWSQGFDDDYDELMKTLEPYKQKLKVVGLCQ